MIGSATSRFWGQIAASWLRQVAGASHIWAGEVESWNLVCALRLTVDHRSVAGKSNMPAFYSNATPHHVHLEAQKTKRHFIGWQSLAEIEAVARRCSSHVALLLHVRSFSLSLSL